MISKQQTPKIRLTGFSEDWVQKKLAEEVSFFSGLTYTPNDVVEKSGTLVLRSSNVQNGAIALGDNVYVNSEVVNSQNVEVGDSIVVVRNGSRNLIGKHAMITKPMDNTVIGAFMTGIRAPVPSFFNTLLDTQEFHNEVSKNLGATINQITGGMFKAMSFYLPENDEQTAIGDLFQNIDQTIALQRRKHQQTQTLKKSLLSKMFPQKGQMQPEIRLEGFSGDWVEMTIGSISNVFSGGTPSVGHSEYYGGKIPFIRSGEVSSHKTELFITEEGLLNSSAKLVSKGDVLYALYGATSGEVSISKINGAINQAILAIIPSKGYNSEFIAYWLRMNKGNIVNTYLQGGQGNLSGGIIKSLLIKSPSFEEQTAIGQFFKQLDDTISLQAKQLKILDNLKKALLAKMFV